jgi:serine phosphatase RsbU (regulator of sigma subunit)
MGVEVSVHEAFQERLDSGSTVILYTDGLIERRGESLDVGLDRLADAAGVGPHEPGALRGHILAALVAPGNQRHDDVTAMVARLAP